MGIIELLLLAIGLSMDAFAVSVCKGLAIKEFNIKKAAICGLWFGGFQALMPLIGYILGEKFYKYINYVAPYLAFVLLLLIGGNMIWEAFSKSEEETSADTDMKTMFLMAVATSIDALAVGITFACVPVNVIPASAFFNTAIGVIIIGITTFILSALGVKIGNIFGTKYQSKAEVFGGVILILIGVKILLEHFNII